MQKVLWYTALTIVVLFMAVAVFIYIAPHVNWHVSAVLSGSMEPEIKVGALVVTRPIDPEEVAVGDIITFRNISVSENTITHRVTSMGRSSPIYFQTKGDANNQPDPFTVPTQNLVGKICFNTPYWGYFTEFIKTPIGFLLSVVIPGVVLIISYILAVIYELNKKRETGNTVS